MKMVMPKMGMTMEEGTIIEWKKKEGEYVEKGEVILEIMTNKVNIDVEAPASGYLKILKGPDDVVPVGEAIAFVEEEPLAEGIEEAVAKEPEIEEVEREIEREIDLEKEIGVKPEVEKEIKEREKEKLVPVPSALKAERVPASPRARRLAEEKGIPLVEIEGSGPNGAVTEKDVLQKIGEKPPAVPASTHVTVSPLAQKIAEEKGIDLSRVKGTGIDGKITKEDVLHYIEAREKIGEVEKAVKPVVEPVPEITEEEPTKEVTPEIPELKPEPVPKPAQEVPPPLKPKPEPEPVSTETKIPLTGIRKLTADRMSKSKQQSPHLTLEMEVDMTEAAKLKSSLNVTYTDILVKATALSLKKHPMMNSTLKGDHIHLKDDINIGIAVARGEDLLVPVIHHADQLPLTKIAQTTKDLIQRTQADQLTEKDVLDGTFTISNLGMYDIDFFTPIINPPEAAILGVGKIRKKPVVMNNQICIRERLTLSLSFDHRIVNGMPAALFLKEIKILLETPYKLLVEGES
ncbi:MAG: dihydrolipoamide acetyltransferase family protein [Candidatus Methanofastidiosia archaeon]|jgi:pyruvate dehydrogenase E2 component (dihydrolipoamide acetyltransferase)